MIPEAEGVSEPGFDMSRDVAVGFPSISFKNDLTSLSSRPMVFILRDFKLRSVNTKITAVIFLEAGNRRLTLLAKPTYQFFHIHNKV